MKLYRFSPITSQAQLLKAIMHIHLFGHALCRQSFNANFPNAGNVGIFCHYEQEYQALIKMRQRLTHPSRIPDKKYFRLTKPITIPNKGVVPAATYTHLYIRKPDPYRSQVGDMDFFLEEDKY